MSTAVTQTHVAKVLPKSIARVKSMDEKPKLQRTSSIDTIKRINTYICSPQTYLLPAILTTWLKTGQKGLHSSAEKTIFMFRSIIFGSFVFKFLLRGANSGTLNREPVKLDLQSVLTQILKYLHHQLLDVLDSCQVIAFAFKLSVIAMTVQMCLCIFYLSQCLVPVGLWFLMVSAGCIIVLGHKLNIGYLMKRDVKRKVL